MASFCGHCGTALRREMAFCPNCGTAAHADDDTADREMPAWFANGEAPPNAAVAPASVTVARASAAGSGVAAPAPRQPPSPNTVYLWVSGAVIVAAGIVIAVALLVWPQQAAPGPVAAAPLGSAATTAAPTTAPTSAPPTLSPTTRSPTTTRSASWTSWIDLGTRPETIRMYPCRQMVDHGVPYDFVVDYFRKWNWVYLQEGGGGMDQDGNGKPCEGQYPDSDTY